MGENGRMWGCTQPAPPPQQLPTTPDPIVIYRDVYVESPESVQIRARERARQQLESAERQRATLEAQRRYEAARNAEVRRELDELDRATAPAREAAEQRTRLQAQEAASCPVANFERIGYTYIQNKICKENATGAYVDCPPCPDGNAQHSTSKATVDARASTIARKPDGPPACKIKPVMTDEERERCRPK